MDFLMPVLCFLAIPLIAYSEEVLEDDIPVVKGDGGTITTAIEDDVLILTRENFDIQVFSKDIILVEFYAPWCGHCKALAPEYAKAAKMLNHEDPPIPLAKVDATIETELASQYDVTGYPTMYIFKKGEKIQYEGPRTAMGIVEYMKERADPNWKPPPEAVITLTGENFTQTVDNADIILVEFYAPWCGHCKRLAPDYERAAKMLKNIPDPILLAKIDGTAEKELAEKYGASGWPTLMIFRKGNKYDYEGPRDETGIVSYMKEQAKPPSKEMTSTNTLKNFFVKNFDPVIVGFFASPEDAFFGKYQEAANMLRGKFTFFHTFNEDIAKYHSATPSRIILFQHEIYATKYESSKFEFDDETATPVQMAKFIKDNFMPLVGQRSHASRWKYENKYPLVVVYYDVDFSFEHRTQTQIIRKQVAEVAKDYKKILFAISDESEYENELTELGLADSGEDINVGYFDSNKIRYSMEPVEDFSAEELRTFIENVHSGKIPRHIKSLPVPRDNTGPVVTVVGMTFDNLVMKNDKDVLLEFYAPWCGHCKKLEPIYKKLGKAFSDNDKVLIAKIDATANDYPNEFRVNGFPTIYFIPSKDKTNLVTFDGERSLSELTKFVNEKISGHSKDEL